MNVMAKISKIVLMTIPAIASPLPWRPSTLARRHPTPQKTTLSTKMAIPRIGINVKNESTKPAVAIPLGGFTRCDVDEFLVTVV